MIPTLTTNALHAIRAILALMLAFAIVTTATAETVTYEYDPNGNLLLRQTPTQTDSANYDALDRLIADQLGSLPPVQFGYDGNGNRTNQLFDSFSEISVYAPNSNRLVQRGAQTLTYDPSGNLLDDGQGHTYTYNNAGRLKQAFNNGTLVATYTYNADGQRTRKVTSQGTTVYHYDINGNLIEETTDTGAFKRGYLYADNIPIAQIDAGTPEVITYLHTDHLGTPRIGTDANGTVVWTWRSFAFGSSEPNSDPDGDGITTTVDLRYGNSIFDQESGLWLMGQRYYSPALGRFITSDPIGLRGGPNTYAYVGSNPLRWTDRFGLAIGDFPPPPPGSNSNWPTGQFPNNGRWWTKPSYGGGDTWIAHPEDKGHWRHWDIQGPNGEDRGTWPPNPGKPRDGQKKLKPNQCPVDPNADLAQWKPPIPKPQPEVLTPVEPTPDSEPIPFMPLAEPWPMIRVPGFSPVFVP